VKRSSDADEPRRRRSGRDVLLDVAGYPSFLEDYFFRVFPKATTRAWSESFA
jgi:hypothetical protein